MKFFYAIIIPLGIILGSVGISLLLMSVSDKELRKYQADIFIEKPPQEVFNYITDYQKLSLWNDGLEKVLSKNGEKMNVNSHFLEVYGKGKNQYTSDLIVVKIIPDKLLQYRLVFKDYDLSSTYTFEKIEENTKLVFQGNIGYKTAYSRFMSPLYTNQIKKRTEKNLIKLKSLMESNRD